MEILRVATPRGLELKGAIYGDNIMDTVVIMLTGICSNVFQNDLLDATGKILSRNNIACIIAHTMDSFSCFAYSDFSIHKQRNTGVVFDDFDAVYEDVEAYVKFAKQKGWKNIILAGHSLGSNKLIHYLGNTPDDFVDYFIVSSPIDLAYWWSIIPQKDTYLKMAQEFLAEGRENDIMPFLFGGFSPMSAKTVLGFYNAENLKNCPVLSRDGETNSLYSIRPNGSFIIGSKDSVVGDDAGEFIMKINSCCKHPGKNQVIVVPDASHIFYGKHDEYAATVLKCLQNHFAPEAGNNVKSEA